MMRISAILLFCVLFLIIAAGLEAGPTTAADECLNCHQQLGTPEAEKFLKDVHHTEGLTCASCHGGDPTSQDMEVAMSPKKGFIGVPKASNIPEVCGKCHGPAGASTIQGAMRDVLTEFKAGVHGKASKESPDGPQCLSCHGVHNIQRTGDKTSPVYPTNVVKTCSKCHSDAAYMKKFNPSIPVDQYEKYLTSIHGKQNAQGDWKAATCVSCHSNHLIYPVKDPRAPVYPTNVPSTCAKCHSDRQYMASYHIPTSQFADYQKSVHGIALLKNSDLSAPACNSCHGNHGAAPPGVNSTAAVCGMCHQANAELFENSPHKEVFDAMGLPACVQCHGNHLVVSPSDKMIGLDKTSTCGSCHESSDEAAKVIVKTRDTLNALTNGQEEAKKQLAHAEQLGMDIAEAKYSLKDVNQSVIEARVKIHSFALPPVMESAGPGLKIIDQAKKAARTAVDEYYFRRKGLGISTLILTVLVVLLFAKIKRIEQEQKKDQ
jgi:hypothetical protein